MLAATIAAAFWNTALFTFKAERCRLYRRKHPACDHKIRPLPFSHTRRSAEYLIRMGEDPSTILGIGCPSSDIARKFDRSLPLSTVNVKGSGAIIECLNPFFHAISSDNDRVGGRLAQMLEVLDALHTLKTQTVWLWPNIDAGSDISARQSAFSVISTTPPGFDVWTNLTPEDYLKSWPIPPVQ